MEANFVSRGGIKLQHALKEFNVDVKDKIAFDVGSSTGGFVDCLLQNGALKVYSLDTAYGELAWKLRNDPRVIVMERTNILHLETLPENVDIVSIDVTFTSLEKILPVVEKFLKPSGFVVALVKPQYEDQKVALKNHGVVPENSQQEILQRVLDYCMHAGWKINGVTDSPILGGSGNKEFLISLCK